MAIDLSCWKITLPVPGNEGNPAEVKQPALNTFSHPKWFRRLPDGALAFAAPVTGFTTTGSKYPRSELREMTPGGKDQAAWSSTDGKTHTMTIVQAVTRLPGGKPHIVCGQIHDGKNDISVWRLEAGKLWITSGNDKHTFVTDSYQLGTKFTVKFEVSDGIIRASYNGKLVAAITAKHTGLFFKAGAYVQANKDNASPVSESNQGEVIVHALEVSHGVPVPAPPPPAIKPVIMLIRHAEKDDNADGQEDSAHRLSERGLKRAAALPLLFTSARVPVPTWIFASKGASNSMRMLETAQPTADQLGLTVDTRYDSENAISETAKLLVDQAKAGRVVLAVLEYSAIPGVAAEVAKLIGAAKPPSDWSDATFDQGWLFSGGTFSVFDQSVLPGDRGYQPPEEPDVSEFEKDARARWPGEDALERDLRGDLHHKQLQLDRIEAAVKRIEEKLGG